MDSEEFSSCDASQKLPVLAISRSARRCFSSTLFQVSGMAIFYEHNPCCFGVSQREHWIHGGADDTPDTGCAGDGRGDLGRRLAPSRYRAPDSLVAGDAARLNLRYGPAIPPGFPGLT